MVGKEVFYAALWGSVLVSPAVRLPASLFVVGHISRDSPGKEQKYMLGTDYQLTVGALSSLGCGGQWGAQHRWSLGLPRDIGEQCGNGVRVCNDELLSQMGRRHHRGNPGWWCLFLTCIMIYIFK